MEKIKALMFNLSSENLDLHKKLTLNMLSGNNVLTDIIQFESGEFVDSPFVQHIEIPARDEYNFIKNEDMSSILCIDDDDLLYYKFFKQKIMNSRLSTVGGIGGFKILLDKSMFEREKHVYEIRYRHGDTWTSWQAIAGKFIVAQEYRFGPGGIAEVYNSMNVNEVEAFKDEFQIRYCGKLFEEMVLSNALHRIYNDPYNNEIRKIIDPSTYQILFDSQMMQDFSREKISKIWLDFDERYRVSYSNTNLVPK